MATLSAGRPTETAEFGDYVSVLRRRWRWPVVGALLGVVLAFAYTRLATPIYTGHAQVLVTPDVPPSSSARPDQLVSMPTEAQIASSGAVASLARRTLGVSRPVPALIDDLTVTSDPDSLVLDFAFTAGTRDAAATGANAFAHAYLTYKDQQSSADAAAKLQEYRTQLASLQTQRARKLDRQNSLDPTSPQYQKLQVAIQNFDLLIASLQSQIATIVPGLQAEQGKLILSAIPPVGPSSPNPPMDLALGLLVALFVGTLLGFARDRVDEKLRGRSHLAELIDAPVLAVVPHTNVPRKGAWVATLDEPRGPAAEAYRTLRTNVLAMAAQHDLKLIAVTSAMPEEGKSTTSANLALSLAQAGKATLLVSGDLRKPGISKLFGMANTWGLVDIVRRGSSLSDVVQTASIERLKVLNTGPVPASPAELLQSPQMRQMLTEQREVFDFVIVDCSPVLGLADALAIAPVTDGVLLVASGRSKQGAIAEARAELDQVGARVVGTVMNDIPLKRLKTKAYGYGGRTYRYAAEGDRAPEVIEGSNGSARRPKARPEGAGRRDRRGRRPGPERAPVRPSSG
jgi:capsular exopolysaccharide synthesis family protein